MANNPEIRKTKHNKAVKLTDSCHLKALEFSLGIEEAIYNTRIY
jgi:hypothetical protein